ncbi:beta-N-acetylhexosaminidase [Thiofilum flexile]|uniref:beta-N-acetylhexosaminidase n=1 Tax=Thiofilum flexile TaxID=125627 RepID=UPI00037FFDE1|nr:beta-N-acetylhexosaminidase [Thiofilum flexile]
MELGPLMLDLTGVELSAEERELVNHPLIGGIIFFSRNYQSIEQLKALIAQIRAASKRRLLLSVDHEGGRVQRFRGEFTRLPSLRRLGEYYAINPAQAKAQAKEAGWLMAAELRALDIDFSYAPVLDLDYGVSLVIGDRSLHRDPTIVSELALDYIQGMREAGMASTGKHFPGHGFIEADSHHAIPIDSRSLEQIQQDDIQPFKKLIQAGLNAVMPAHVIYEKVDPKPAGFSSYWIQTILRQELGFQGLIFSDDLSMEGATVAGSYAERAQAALTAGCDMIMACNRREGIIDILEHLKYTVPPASQVRIQAMQGKPFMNHTALLQSTQWQQAHHLMSTLG